MGEYSKCSKYGTFSGGTGPSSWDGEINLLDSISFSGANVDSITSDSFTPTANALLFVEFPISAAGHSTEPDFQISNTGGLSFTRYQTATIDFAGASDYAGALFVATVGGSPSAMTVTVDPYPDSNTGYCSMVVWEVTNGALAQPIKSRAVLLGDGSNDVSHTTAPLDTDTTSGNLVVAGFGCHETGAVAMTPPEDFETLVAQTGTYSIQGVFYSTEFEGTTVTCPDLGNGVYVSCSWIMEIEAN